MGADTKSTVKYIRVAIPTPLDQLFTYTHSEDLEPGVRVKVPFGPRSVIGVVWESTDQPENPDLKFRAIREVLDVKPVYSATLLQMARWLSLYYLHPLGEVLRTMLPAGSKSNKKITYRLTSKGQKYGESNEEHAPLIRHCFGKRLSLTQVTLRKKLKAWPDNASDLEPWFVNKGYLRKDVSQSLAVRKVREETATRISSERGDHGIRMNAEQQEAFDRITQKGILDDARKPFLLFGVTGSGKTEVYMRLIAEIVDRDTSSQVLMMVPEISLTPQMTRVFTARFPDQVEVVHSNLTEAERWQRLEQIRKGKKRVLVGPRSAVFASFQNLGLILVDEEHDQSYKQATGLQYNGRDVAVVRAGLERATIVLGSATPSLESYYNALIGKYELCSLQERAMGNPLPDVELIESDPSKGGRIVSKNSADSETEDLPLAEEVITALRENLTQAQQSIVIVNRRGYAFYLFDVENKEPVRCPDCSVSLTVHGRNQFLKCHYCDYKTSVAKILDEYPDKAYVVMGYGSQKAESFLRAKIPGARIVRLDSDTALEKDQLQKTLEDFRNHEIDILVGTQILAKGHDFPKVTLIAIVEVDKQMSLPDFRAGERSFQLLVQAAGRAGRADIPGRVLVQTAKKKNRIIELATKQNFVEFAKHEIEFRRAHHFPPFSRLIAVEYSSEDYKKLMRFDQDVEAWLETYEERSPLIRDGLTITGPLFPPIQTIRGRHRRQILFRDEDMRRLKQGTMHFLTAFQKLPGDMRLRVDVDPQTML